MVVPQTQRPALSGTALKRLALCSMLLDHLGASCLEAGVFSRPGPISEPLLTLDLCLRWAGRLAQPDQPTALGALADRQQAVKRAAVEVAERCAERFIDLACATCQRLAAHALDDIEGRKDDALLPQQLDQCLGQHDTPVGLLGQIGELVDEVPIVRDSERRQLQPRLQLQQVLAPGFWPLRILRPDVRSDA